MDKQKAIQSIIAYHNQQLNPIEFLAEYITDRGKPLDKFEEFITILQVTDALQGAIEYALNWYKNEYSICTLSKIVKTPLGSSMKFITAY